MSAGDGVDAADAVRAGEPPGNCRETRRPRRQRQREGSGKYARPGRLHGPCMCACARESMSYSRNALRDDDIQDVTCIRDVTSLFGNPFSYFRVSVRSRILNSKKEPDGKGKGNDT